MATIALFHSVLGPREGVHDAAALLRDHGHEVLVVDQYGGRTFDDYESASAHAESIGFPALMQLALDATAGLRAPFVTAGFSNGGGMAEFVATARPGEVAGVLMLSGALPLQVLGAQWPAGVPAQIHYALDDPLRNEEWVQSVAATVREAGGGCDVFDYPGSGHVFTDASKADEFQPEEATLLWERVLAFLARVDATAAGAAVP
jgi:dienelactone hydrolase